MSLSEFLSIHLPSDLFLDERVHSAFERVKDVRGEPHRFQYIFVVRGDQLAQFEKDMGANSQFPGATLAFNFLALFEYSVGEVMEVMDYRRYDQPEPELPHDLWDTYRVILDEKKQLRAHRSVIGPYIRIQR